MAQYSATESGSNVICAKLAYMNSLALSVSASNTKLVLSIMREQHDIRIERTVRTELMVTKVEEGERQWHFKYDE
ncbi:MAG: hypothetical protein HW419_4571 [Deltaproteobacteria bacterium]|nr:hypothetical protein [Deltaproteobacteria bacterium]